MAKKQSKQSGKKSGKAASKKTTAQYDDFGNRIGTIRAKINAMLTFDKPVKMADITKALGCKTNYNHLGDLIERKLVKKTKAGYVRILPKPGK